MSKHFKTKRKLRHDILIKYLLIIVLGIIIVRICLSLILCVPVIKYIFIHNKIGEFKEYIVESTINNPLYMLDYYSEEISYIPEDTVAVTYIVNDKPLVYIYNTHQKEAYSDNKTVLDASKYFKEQFAKYNIDTIVEERDITEFMRTNNISYSYSYYASKFYIEDMLSQYNLSLLIDLHRDAADKKAVTLNYEEKSYAKILFVVGGENENYKVNYALAHHINNLITSKYADISRGVIVKTGKNVNGIYNQNLSSDMILLEIGSENSTFEEVKNTIELIVPIIGEYLYEKR